MTDWSLTQLLASLHEEIQHRLRAARQSFGHPGSKGDASEAVWLQLFQNYLPKRYQAEKAFVVDSNGIFSDQIDVVIFDRQYSPFIFLFEDQKIIPAESVYAVFEARQSINAGNVAYAQGKVAKVCAACTAQACRFPMREEPLIRKPLIPILGGLLTFESVSEASFGEPLGKALSEGDAVDGSILDAWPLMVISSIISRVEPMNLSLRGNPPLHSYLNLSRSFSSAEQYL